MAQITAANAAGDAMAARLGEIATAHARLRAQAAEIGESAAREPIALPGWTRAHVLFHLADLSRAFARQAEYALRGESIELYDGGRPTRDRRIEENHGKPLGWIREQLEEGLSALETAWDALSAADWELPCSYRNGPLTKTQLAWWRETELHSVDLMCGYHTKQWSPALSAHVVGFLLPRLEDAGPLRLRAADMGETWPIGAEAPDAAVIEGSVTELAGWLSGRPDAALPTATGSAELPEPGAWP
jgi:maleylpyruvate isomerase